MMTIINNLLFVLSAGFLLMSGFFIGFSIVAKKHGFLLGVVCFFIGTLLALMKWTFFSFRISSDGSGYETGVFLGCLVIVGGISVAKILFSIKKKGG